MRSLILITLFAFSASIPAGALGTTDTAAADGPSADVDVGDFFFRDHATGNGRSEIDIGGTVTWHWVSGMHQVRHDVGAPLGQDTPVSTFQSSLQSAGSFSTTFDLPGVFTYYCTIHPDMQGTVIVA